jgi:glycosyltransferase involved in cell wall biosynthesis
VRDDYFSEYYKQTHSKLSLFLAKFTLKRALSIRASTETIRDTIIKLYPHAKDVSVLPKFSDLESLVASANKGTSTGESFPQFTFVMLYVGVLDYESTLFRAIDAARSALFSKGVGLVVLGDGPAKAEFEKRAQILGVGEQVLFRKDMSQLGTYLKDADILICPDTTDASDELLVKAAASGLPILAAENHFRSDLFVDGTDAFLCPKEDTVCFSQKLIKFLNTNALRTQFSDNAKEIVTTRLSEDPEVYRQAYRDSIESVFDAK